jgi:hypothetical protein
VNTKIGDGEEEKEGRDVDFDDGQGFIANEN